MPEAQPVGYNAKEATHLVDMFCQDIIELTMENEVPAAVAITNLAYLIRDIQRDMRESISRADLTKYENRRDRIMAALEGNYVQSDR